MWLIDFPSLLLIIAAGMQLGLQGSLGIDAAGQLLGEYKTVLFDLMGFSALWQLARQRFH
jgi:uncharacterized membrane protein YuzA (DUF378 family)